MAYQGERLASFLKKETAAYLIKNFPHPTDVFLSVTEAVVDQSGDSAKIFVSIFPDKNSADTLKNVKKYEGEIRKFLSSRLRRHKIPKIIFVLDKNFESGIRLEKLLEKVENEKDPAR